VPAATRVLIVDDSCYFRRAARALLERRGYEVVGEAPSAAAARDAVAQLAPDAVLLDVVLPDDSGFAVCADLADRTPAPAVLLVSSEDFSACYALAEEWGAKGFVLKSQLAHCDLTAFWPRPVPRR
jgi:two-component system, chemotaxis family, chemotaxis protein CheY